MNPRGRIDMSNMTPEQQEQAKLMAQFMNGPEGQRVFVLVGLAEKLYPTFLSLEHLPGAAAERALDAARVMHAAGEKFMNDTFQAWCEKQPKQEDEPVVEIYNDEVTAIKTADKTVNADAAALEESPVEGHVVKEETISRDQAVADTAERVAAGEPVKVVTE